MHLITLLISYLAFVSLSHISDDSCPTNCTCRRIRGDTLEIQCQKTSFHQIISKLKHNRRSIYIETADTKDIRSFAFNSTPWITNLYISAPALINIEDYAFANLSDLRSLQIHKCPRFATVRENTLKGLHKLTSLDIDRCNLSSIDRKAFLNTPNLEFLQFKSNLLTQLHEETFSSLYKIRFLAIVQNKLTFISNKLFANNYNLETLRLGDNNIDTIEDNALTQLSKLESLSIENNRLKSIDNLFLNFSQLDSLDISGNQIQNFSVETLSKSNKLSYLSLSNNRLKEIRHFFFTYLRSLRFLMLSFNQISYIDGSAFQNLTSLWYIYLDNNQINEITEKHFSRATNLRGISLQNNVIHTINKNAFTTTVRLYRINLSNNKIRELPLKIFRNSTRLNTIDLSQNNITDINKISFENLHHLERLDLSKNNISQAPDVFWRSMSKITVLLLNDNQLKCVNKNHLHYLKSIKVLDLRQNIMFCTFYLVEAFRLLPTFAQLHADCIDQDNRRINVNKLILNDLLSKWFKRKLRYELEPGFIIFNNQSLTNEYLIRFKFKIESQRRYTKYEIQPGSVKITLTYKGQIFLQFEHNFQLENSFHEVELKQEKESNYFIITIFIDGCTTYREERYVNKRIPSIRLNFTDLFSNYSISLFQNVSIFTKECSDGKYCLKPICETKQNEIASFSSPSFYPVNISRAIALPPTFEELHPIRLSRNVTLCRGIPTSQIYISSRGYMSLDEEAITGLKDEIVIAPFLSNITNCFSGSIYVEEGWDLDAREIVQRDTNTTSLPDYLLMVTWVNLTNMKNKTTKNSFQLVIALSSNISVVMFKYANIQDQAERIGLFGCDQLTRAEQMCYLRNLSASTATNTFFYTINELADGNPCHHNNDYKDQLLSSVWVQLLLLVAVLFGIAVFGSLILFCGRQINKSIQS